jgi:phage gp29-like protein
VTNYVQLRSGVVMTERDYRAFAEAGGRPELREIATTGAGRDITRGYVFEQGLLETQDDILRAQGGNLRVYEELLRDDQVGSTFHQRRRAVVAREWDVQPGGERRADKRAADALREMLDHIRFDQVTDKMLYGVYYGYGVAECLWARDGAQVMLDQVRVRKPRRFAFGPDHKPRLLTVTAPLGEPLPERKFWHFQTGADNDDEPYGLGLAHWLYWPVFFKRNGVKLWLIFLEKFGQPTALGKFEPSATADERSRLLAALSAIQTDAGIIIPKGMEVELIEAARSGTADYTMLYDRMNAAIAKVVLGQTASTEGTPGRLGNDDLQGDVRLDLVKADADLVCDSFNRGPARWLTDWNFPGAAYPKVWRDVEEPEDLNSRAERDAKLYTMGFKPTLQEITTTYGGEWVETRPAPPAEDGAPAPGTAPAFAEGDAAAADATEAQLAQLQRTGDAAVAAWVEQIRAVVDEADSLEELRDRLLELHPKMDPARFAEAMGDALAAAHLAGRYDLLNRA